MKRTNLIKELHETAEWADANLWDVPITLPDILREAADTIERDGRERTMNAKDREIQELRADLEWLMRSETVARFAEKDSFGRHINDIGGIDRCVLTLAAREKEAKQKLMAAEAEIVRLRRQIESLQEKREGDG